MSKPCLVVGCTRMANGRRWCHMHYKRLQKTGDTGPAESMVTRLPDEMSRMSKRRWSLSPEERFNTKWVLHENSGCWVWQDWLSDRGYGYFYVGKKRYQAHRWSYTHFKKVSIPGGFEIDHKCNNTSCVNPAHLQPVTKLKNMQLQWERRRQTNPPGAS